MSNEINIRMQEMLNESEQRTLIGMMLERGVKQNHLPPSADLKRLQSILRRGVIKGGDELVLVRMFLGDPLAKSIAGWTLGKLGVLFDRYAVKNN